MYEQAKSNIHFDCRKNLVTFFSENGLEKEKE
jgi:hypothetical protein